MSRTKGPSYKIKNDYYNKYEKQIMCYKTSLGMHKHRHILSLNNPDGARSSCPKYIRYTGEDFHNHHLNSRNSKSEKKI